MDQQPNINTYAPLHPTYRATPGYPMPAMGAPVMQGQFPAAGAQMMPGQFPMAGAPTMPGQFPMAGAPTMPGQLPVATGQMPGAPGVPLAAPPAPMFEESYIENILRLNLGKIGTFYMTYENNREWNAKIFKGRLEAAGRDHIIISDPATGMRFLLLMVNLDYATFEGELNYAYPFAGPTGPTGPTPAAGR